MSRLLLQGQLLQSKFAFFKASTKVKNFHSTPLRTPAGIPATTSIKSSSSLVSPEKTAPQIRAPLLLQPQSLQVCSGKMVTKWSRQSFSNARINRRKGRRTRHLAGQTSTLYNNWMAWLSNGRLCFLLKKTLVFLKFFWFGLAAMISARKFKDILRKKTQNLLI